MGARAEAFAFQALLSVLGTVMALASRRVNRFRRQVSRDLVVEIVSADGPQQQFGFDGATRRMHTSRNGTKVADVTLRFGSSRDGLRTLLSPHAVGRIVEGMNTGETRIDGNPVLILWFYGLSRVVVPIGSSRRPRKPAPVPVRSVETEASYSHRILREPPVTELSRDWPQAWAAREKLLQLRAPSGEPLPPG